jgi:hypothetical protein
MKARSPEQNGQFPALVEVEWPARLKLEVTNLLGGAEALLEVTGDRMSLRQLGGSAGNRGSREVVGSWGGIPLRWAVTLFSGRVPCPTLSPDWVLAWGPSDRLEARRVKGVPSGEKFSYELRSWGGRPWVEALEWTQGGAPEVVSLRIELKDPDLKSGRARRWEAKSSRGEVTVRWKDREVLAEPLAPPQKT